MRGRKPKPTVIKILEGNPGKRAINGAEPKPPRTLPTCPEHLSAAAKAEWKRLAKTLNQVGLLTQADRTVMAGYCQCYGRWVEAELKLAETPLILRTPAGYIQQSPWLSISNKQRWVQPVSATAVIEGEGRSRLSGKTISRTAGS